MDLSYEQLQLDRAAVARYVARQRKQVERRARTIRQAPVWVRARKRRKLVADAWAYCFLVAVGGELGEDEQIKDLPPRVVEACEQEANREVAKLLG